MVDGTAPQEPTGYVTLWATLFFDLLGWSTKVLALDDVGDFRADQGRVDSTVYAPILDYKRAEIALKTQLEAIVASPDVDAVREKWLQKLPVDKQRMFRVVTELPHFFRTAGDSFVVSIGIHGDEHYSFAPAAMRLSKLIGVAATAFLLLLSEGIPVRAAIEAGRGTTYEPHGGGPEEFIGASLVHAYRLESQKADYPRVMIGPRLYTFIKSMAEDTTKDVDLKITQPMAKRLLEMLHVEADGTVSVDYLHPKIRALVGFKPEARIERAYRFVSESFGRANVANNSRLVGMYGLVYAYFFSRLGPLSPSAPGSAPDSSTAPPGVTPPDAT